MNLFHVTTPKKLSRYNASKRIIKPVRGFSNIEAAKEWARITRRSIIVEFTADDPHKLPDHHNKYGTAWWNDNDVKDFKIVYEE